MLCVDGLPETSPNPRSNARWTDAFTRSRGHDAQFAIRDTELGSVAEEVIASLTVSFHRSSMMFSSSYSHSNFLDGGWQATAGYGFGSVSGQWVVGFHAFRFVCGRMGLRGPRHLKGESEVPEHAQLEADFHREAQRKRVVVAGISYGRAKK